MDYSKIAKSYTAQAIETASPGKLVLMLFDGALRFMTAAREGFKNEDFMKRNEAINNNLIKAQNIVAELQSSLDMNVSGELPGTLYKLYDFVYYQLQQANLKALASKAAADQESLSYGLSARFASDAPQAIRPQLAALGAIGLKRRLQRLDQEEGLLE